MSKKKGSEKEIGDLIHRSGTDYDVVGGYQPPSGKGEKHNPKPPPPKKDKKSNE